MKTTLTIGQYLIQQLHAHGVRHVFGIPGDYVLGFYDQLSKGPPMPMRGSRAWAPSA